MCDITLSHQPFDVHARNGNLKLSIVQCLRNKNQERTTSFGGQSHSEARVRILLKEIEAWASIRGNTVPSQLVLAASL